MLKGSALLARLDEAVDEEVASEVATMTRPPSPPEVLLRLTAVRCCWWPADGRCTFEPPAAAVVAVLEVRVEVVLGTTTRLEVVFSLLAAAAAADAAKALDELISDVSSESEEDNVSRDKGSATADRGVSMEWASSWTD